MSDKVERIVPDEVSLELATDAKRYTDKQFLLNITDGNGRIYEVVLDGIQLGDIIADARDAGMPVEWPYLDGMPRNEP